MEELIEKIKTGKQRGFSKKVLIEDIAYWCNAAIQKFQGKYKVHISSIKEDNMSSEKYEIYFTREFNNIEEAFACIKENGPIALNEFTALKGQRIFNPAFNEENDT